MRKFNNNQSVNTPRNKKTIPWEYQKISQVKRYNPPQKTEKKLMTLVHKNKEQGLLSCGKKYYLNNQNKSMIILGNVFVDRKILSCLNMHAFY